MRLFRALKEIRNFLFIGRTLTKASKTKEWKEFNLRRGWFNVAYTVINLPPEVYESEEIYYRTYVVEQLSPINDFFAKLNLSEVVSVEVEDVLDKEQGVFAFLVKYEPLFKALSLRWLIKWCVILLILWWVVLKFNLVAGSISVFWSIINLIKV
jgi:hypothetical protein